MTARRADEVEEFPCARATRSSSRGVRRTMCGSVAIQPHRKADTMPTQEELLTPGHAAKKLKVSLETVQLFLKERGRTARARVHLDDVRAWLVEQDEQRRRQRKNWETYEAWVDKTMLLDRLGLGEEHLDSVHPCTHCGEPCLDPAVAVQLGMSEIHTCRDQMGPASPK